MALDSIALPRPAPALCGRTYMPNISALCWSLYFLSRCKLNIPTSASPSKAPRVKLSRVKPVGILGWRSSASAVRKNCACSVSALTHSDLNCWLSVASSGRIFWLLIGVSPGGAVACNAKVKNNARFCLNMHRLMDGAYWMALKGCGVGRAGLARAED